MIYCPKKPKYNKIYPDVNKELSLIRGEMDDKLARVTLAKYLRHNLGISTELLSGVKLELFQELMLKGWFNRNFSLNVMGRGCSKSYLAAVFCFLHCIFEPNTKIMIAGPTMRTSKIIFDYLERFVCGEGAELLRQIFLTENRSKRNELFEWTCNGGSVRAIPLNGEKIRGFRANILLLDEFLLLPKTIIDNVLIPFLVSPQDLTERIKIRELENALIKEGLLNEENKLEFENTAKMIALSSASYTFENLFDVYKSWENKIEDENNKEEATYAIYQIGFQAIPEHMIEKNVIEMAQTGGLSNAGFLREYCALFTDESSSYYSAKKMHECTIPDGQLPVARIVGEKDKKYVLSIDPNLSNSPSADNFAMSIMELDMEKKDSTLIHCYAFAGQDFKDNMKYLYYILKNFNIVLIMGDSAGVRNFIDGCNESELFIREKIQLSFFDFDSDKLELEYEEMIQTARTQYNLSTGKICVEQYFDSIFIRRGNEELQKNIDYKKIWFGSSLNGNNSEFNKAMANFDSKKYLEYTNYDLVSDLIQHQEVFIHQTKKECALIEPRATAKGNLTFDLPSTFNRDNKPNRVRKDSYTALLLGNWGAKCYFDLMTKPEREITKTFVPFLA